MSDNKKPTPPPLSGSIPKSPTPSVPPLSSKPTPPPLSTPNSSAKTVSAPKNPSGQINPNIPPMPKPASPPLTRPPITPAQTTPISASLPPITPSPKPVQVKPTSPSPALANPTPVLESPSQVKKDNNPPLKKSSNIKSSPFKYVGIIVAVLLVGLVGWFAVSKLLGGKSPKTQNTTITYWGLWEPSSALESVFADFQIQNPGVTINYVTQSHKDYRERLQAAIARGQGPDLFRYHNTWVPLMKGELASLPSDVMSSSEFERTFYPITQKDLSIGGKYVGIPLEFDGLALYYNTKIFKRANKTPPKTWEELRRVAAELTLRNEQEKIIRGGVALGTTSNVDHWSDILGLMMLQNAANPAVPNDERAEDSLAFYTIFSKSDRVWDDTMPPSTIAFATEKVAMMIAPSWRAFDIKHSNPQLEFATVPTPQLTNVNLHWASYWAEGVSNQSTQDKQKLAWELIKFMSEPENLRKFYQDASQIRLFGEPYPRVDMAQELEDDPVVGAFISSAPTAQSWWMSSWTHDNGLNDRIIKYYEDAVNASNQGRPPGKALETTVEGVVQVLSQFGVSGAL